MVALAWQKQKVAWQKEKPALRIAVSEREAGVLIFGAVFSCEHLPDA